MDGGRDERDSEESRLDGGCVLYVEVVKNPRGGGSARWVRMLG